MKGTRNRFSCCIRGCSTDSSKGLSGGASGKDRAASALCLCLSHCLPHSCSSHVWPSPGCPEMPTKSRQRCADKDFCCYCPSLPCSAPGKRAITPLSEISVDSLWTPCLRFRAWLQSFRAMCPRTGYKPKTAQQPTSDNRVGFGTTSWKGCLPWLLVSTLLRRRKLHGTLLKGNLHLSLLICIFNSSLSYTKFVSTRVVNT